MGWASWQCNEGRIISWAKKTSRATVNKDRLLGSIKVERKTWTNLHMVAKQIYSMELIWTKLLARPITALLTRVGNWMALQQDWWKESQAFHTYKVILRFETPCVCAELLSCVQFFASLWTVAHQASLFMGFFRQEYWSVLPFPSPGHLPDPGFEPRSPALQADSLPLSHQRSLYNIREACIHIHPYIQHIFYKF